jgi:uncharacterized protein (DUF2267 family)
MDEQHFLTVVAEAAGCSLEEARRTAQVVLQVLGERIGTGEARDLAELLPPELASWVMTDHPARSFDATEFVRRVADALGLDPATAEWRTRAVLTALHRAVGESEFEDVAAELSRDYWRLLPAGPWVGVVPAESFIERVAERTGLDPDGARRAIAAVLTTLAERIAGGEVDDLIALLPAELHEPLRKGKALSGGNAARMSLEEFERRVAEREGVGPQQAHDHARVVLQTLREAVGDDEFLDVTSQLPAEYVDVLVR